VSVLLDRLIRSRAMTPEELKWYLTKEGKVKDGYILLLEGKRVFTVKFWPKDDPRFIKPQSGMLGTVGGSERAYITPEDFEEGRFQVFSEVIHGRLYERDGQWYYETEERKFVLRLRRDRDGLFLPVWALHSWKDGS